MKAVFEIVKKNIKNLIRSKVGSLIVILGPLIVIFLAGLAFDNANAYSVKIGTFQPTQNEVTSGFIEQLRTQFKVIEYETENECIEAIKQTDVNTCLVFDENFTIGIPTKNQLTFYVDYSRINLVWTILQVMTENVEAKNLQASQTYTKLLIDAIEYTQEKITEEKQAIIKLTTQNDLVLKNTNDLMTELSNVDLQLSNDLDITALNSKGTQLKQWAQSAISLGESGLSKAASYIGTADALVKTSGSTNIEQITASFKKSIEDINKLKEDLSKTKDVSNTAVQDFDEQIQIITEGISNTKKNLEEADTSREFSIRVLQAIQKLLDDSLMSISQVQKTINEIETKISNIEVKDAEAITQPIVTNIKPITQEKTYLHYLFPVLIVLIIMFTALLITPTLILLDKHSPANFRTYLTPVKDSSYIIATFITSSIILLIQVIIMLAITSVFFSTQIFANAPGAFLLLLIINSLFILIGMIIGYLFNSEETATLAAVSVGALFLFISDVIIPLESMPEAFAYIASFNPYVLGSSLLRRLLLFDASMISIIQDLFILLGYIIATALLATGVYMMTRRQSLQKLAKRLAPVMERFKKK